MNSEGTVTTSSSCDTTRLTYISTLNGDAQSQLNDIASGATTVGYAAKATSCTQASKATSATSATYSSTANYAKNAPQYKGATTAAAGTKGLVPAASTAARLRFLRGDGTWSTPHEGTATYAGSAAKATSATSATYSSTANYAKKSNITMSLSGTTLTITYS